MQKVASGLVVIQDACRTRPADPTSGPPNPAPLMALGSEAASKDLLTKVDNMQAQVPYRI